MSKDISASVPDQALAVPAEPANGLGPSGFDPSRINGLKVAAYSRSDALRTASPSRGIVEQHRFNILSGNILAATAWYCTDRTERREIDNWDDAASLAHLIAAAPDMYEALSDLMENPVFLVSIGGNPNMVDALMDRARAALAKARGQ